MHLLRYNISSMRRNDNFKLVSKSDKITIFNLNKKNVDELNYSLFKYYSRIICYQDKIVGLYLPLLINYKKFEEKHNKNKDDFVSREYISGHQILLCYCDDKWYFFSKDGDQKKEEYFKNKLTCIIDIGKLNKGLCYNFILESNINKRSSNNFIYLLSIYEIQDTHLIEHDIYSCWLSYYVKIPKLYIDTDFSDDFLNMNIPSDISGIVMSYNNNYTVIKNENSTFIYNINQKTFYQYVSLYQQNKVNIFLSTNKKYECEFLKYEKMINKYIKSLHKIYLLTYVYKKFDAENNNKKFKLHLSRLHKYYISYLRENKKCITIDEVKKYISNLPTNMLYYNLLNNNIKYTNPLPI